MRFKPITLDYNYILYRYTRFSHTTKTIINKYEVPIFVYFVGIYIDFRCISIAHHYESILIIERMLSPVGWFQICPLSMSLFSASLYWSISWMRRLFRSFSLYSNIIAISNNQIICARWVYVYFILSVHVLVIVSRYNCIIHFIYLSITNRK